MIQKTRVGEWYPADGATPEMEKFEKQVNDFLSEHKDTIIVKDIKYTATYPNPHNSAWQDWTAMVIYEVVKNND